MKSSIFHINPKITVVEIYGSIDQYKISYLVSEKVDTFIQIDSSGEITNLSDLKNILKTNSIHLIINLDKVLTKKIENTENIEERNIFHEVFPALKEDDFVFEVMSKKNNGLISIIRKSDFLTLWNIFKENNFIIHSISLGNTAILDLFQYIPNNTLTTSNAQVWFGNESINEIIINRNIENSIYKIKDIRFKNTETLSVSLSINKLLFKDKTHNNFNQIKELKLSNGFSVQNHIKVFLYFLFALLLLNFLLFNYFENKIKTSTEKNSVIQFSNIKIEEITKQIKEQDLLLNMFYNSDSDISLLIDELAVSIPSSILLNELSYQPITKKIKPNESVSINQNTLLLSGISSSKTEFTDWLTYVEKKDWTKSITIIEFKEKLNTSNFKIKIDLKDEWKIE